MSCHPALPNVHFRMAIGKTHAGGVIVQSPGQIQETGSTAIRVGWIDEENCIINTLGILIQDQKTISRGRIGTSAKRDFNCLI